MLRGKLLHRTISPAQAEILRRAIAIYRTIPRLLRAWEAETVKIMDAENPRKRGLDNMLRHRQIDPERCGM